MCIEARLDGCVKRLLGIPVLKWPIFFVRWSLKEFSAPFLSDVLSLFYRMFLSPSVSCFSFLLSVVSLSFVRCFSFLVVEGCVCFLFTAHFYPAHTSWCEYHVELSAAYLFLTSDLHFLHAQSVILLLRSGLICCVRKVKRKIPVSFTPNSVNHNFLLHPCEVWRWKTKNSWRAYARAKGRERTVLHG